MERAYALDVLRGCAIVAMVLSGSIVFGILPGWMYHAQSPPPTNIFNPEIPGITWVDLVFPFFLFAMGAAFPFSINKKIAKGETTLNLICDAGKRYIQLTFFAIFIQHFYPWNLGNPQDYRDWILSIVCFTLLFPMFMRMPFNLPKWGHYAIKTSAYLIAIILLYSVTYTNNRSFSPAFSNIIILVLANMAFWGTLVYLLSRKNKQFNLVIMSFVAVILLGSKIEGSYTESIFNFTPLPWLYKFLYLKYLLIVIPGTIAGDYLYQWMNNKQIATPVSGCPNNRTPYIIIVICGIIILANIIGLYNRWLNANIIINIVVIAIGLLCLYTNKSTDSHQTLWRKLYTTGAYFILMGLLLEPFEGGIKKDPSTFSYYFLTSGLAFMLLLLLNIVCDYYKIIKSTKFLYQTGQNPMIAYVVTSLFTIPMLNLLNIYPLFAVFSQNPYLGFIQGLILTSIAVIITMFFTRIKWFWKT